MTALDGNEPQSVGNVATAAAAAATCTAPVAHGRSKHISNRRRSTSPARGSSLMHALKSEHQNGSVNNRVSESTRRDNMVSMTGTPLSNGGLVTMATPTSLAEQLLVAVQNLSANGYVQDHHTDEAKSDYGNGQFSNNNNNGSAQALNNSALNSLLSGSNPQLANVLGLAGLPQMAALANIPGLANLGVVGQLAAAAQVVQAAANNNAHNAANNGIQQQLNHQHQMQQAGVLLQSANQTIPQSQMANNGTPQFILAGGQPIQGIQGAQLLIPTSSGVATQQIITIPITQMMTNQMVQLVSNNGQVLTTSLGNLQALNQNTSSSVQTPSVINAGNYSNLNGQVPQILTNPAGQVIAIGSQQQLLAHSLMPSNANGTSNNSTVQLQSPLPAHLPAQSSQQLAHNNSVRQQSMGNGNNHQNNTGLNLVSPSKQQQQHNSDVSLQAAVNLATLEAQLSLNPMVAHLSSLPKQQLSPPSVSSTTSSLLDNGETINQTEANIVDGINLEEIKEFAKAFKIRRLSLGLTQTQVGQALSATEGPSYSQSAICRFEKLDITPKSAQRIKPVLERWMKEAEERYKNGAQNLTEFIGSEPTKKRKRRTSFTPAALEVLNIFFEKNTHPSGSEMTDLAEKLNYDREVVRVWFCNKRQALKNTIKRLKGAV